jgi:hypothetical protein
MLLYILGCLEQHNSIPSISSRFPLSEVSPYSKNNITPPTAKTPMTRPGVTAAVAEPLARPPPAPLVAAATLSRYRLSVTATVAAQVNTPLSDPTKGFIAIVGIAKLLFVGEEPGIIEQEMPQ